MMLHDNSQVFRRPMLEGAKYGSLAGLIATWSISTAIAASELELGLPISTFYAVMGISLGSIDFVTAAYLGFGLHLVTGTILGAIIGGIFLAHTSPPCWELVQGFWCGSCYFCQ